MPKIFWTSLILIFPMTASACGDGEPIKSGTVVSKSYDDPDDWTTREDDYGYTCRYGWFNDPEDGYTYAYHCGNQKIGEHTERHHDGPHWKLRIRDDENRKRIKSVEVNETDWHAFQPGGHWPDPR